MKSRLRLFVTLVLRKEMCEVRPDIISMNSASAACARGGHWRQALAVRREADMVTLCTWISACEKGGQWQRAEVLLLSFTSFTSFTSNLAYNAMITSYERAAKWDYGLRLFNQLQGKPDVITFNATISALISTTA